MSKRCIFTRVIQNCVLDTLFIPNHQKSMQMLQLVSIAAKFIEFGLIKYAIMRD